MVVVTAFVVAVFAVVLAGVVEVILDVVIDQVAGGRGKRAPSDDAEGITRMWCPKCGFQCTWAGDYLHRVYECPDCPGYMYGWLYEGPGGKRV